MLMSNLYTNRYHSVDLAKYRILITGGAGFIGSNLIEYLLSIKYFKNVLLAFAIVLAVTSSIRFCLNANINFIAEWNYDSETKNMLKDLITLHNENKIKQDKVKLGINWIFEPSINFYRQTMHIIWLLPVDREGLKATDECCYNFNSPLDKKDTNTYTVLKKYCKIKTELIKNKK